MKYFLITLILIFKFGISTAQVDFLKNAIDTIDAPDDIFPIDFDQDGDTDILGTGSLNGQVILYENDGSQEFERKILLGDTEGADVGAGDLDGDGDLDLVTMIPPALFGPGKIAWFENDGFGMFETFALETSCNLEEIKIIDLDGDGDNDIVGITSCGSTDKILWWRNDNLTFVMEELIVQTTTLRTFEILDFDFDGHLDFVLPYVFQSELVWYKNNGLSTFQEITINSGSELAGIENIEVVDLDGDGDYEVICGNTTAGTITYSNKMSSGDYEILTIDTEIANPGFIKATDLDLDGDLDLVAADKGFSGSYLWYENVGNTNFERRAIQENAESARRIYLTDFDDDLDQDFIGWSAFPSQINWWENTFCTSSTDTVEVVLCLGESFEYNGVVYDSEGVYSQSFQTQNGCDSSQVIKVTVEVPTGDPLEYTIENNLITLQNVGNLTNVNWIDCDTDDTIAIVQGPNFMPPYDGSFTALITEGICEQGVDCIDYMFVSSIDELSEKTINIFPNPNSGELFFSGIEVESIDQLTIRNMIGTILDVANIQNSTITLKGYSPGMYLIDFQIDGQHLIKKVFLN